MLPSVFLFCFVVFLNPLLCPETGLLGGLDFFGELSDIEFAGELSDHGARDGPESNELVSVEEGFWPEDLSFECGGSFLNRVEGGKVFALGQEDGLLEGKQIFPIGFRHQEFQLGQREIFIGKVVFFFEQEEDMFCRGIAEAKKFGPFDGLAERCKGPICR